MNLFQPTYLLFVGVGVLLALAFPVARHIRDDRLRRHYMMQVSSRWSAQLSAPNFPFSSVIIIGPG